MAEEATTLRSIGQSIGEAFQAVGDGVDDGVDEVLDADLNILGPIMMFVLLAWGLVKLQEGFWNVVSRIKEEREKRKKEKQEEGKE